MASAGARPLCPWEPLRGRLPPEVEVGQPYNARTWSGHPVRPRGRLVCGVGVPAKACRNFVAEGNCVAARRGGEQPEANRRSEGARTRFGANPWRACWGRAKPGTTAGAETTVESDHRTAC